MNSGDNISFVLLSFTSRYTLSHRYCYNSISSINSHTGTSQSNDVFSFQIEIHKIKQ